jgi:hypothetical protein
LNQTEKARVFVETLLSHPTIKQLNLVDDKGITVAVHTYDVMRIAIKEIKKIYNSLDNASGKINLFSIIVGIITHDTTKATLRLGNKDVSHSFLMKKSPELVKKETDSILDEIEEKTAFYLNDETRAKIIQIVLSHHGRWGKISPKSREDEIVHQADKYSATYHRINPICARNIVKLMDKGHTKREILELTGQTEGVITDRLRRAKITLGIKTNKELLTHYQNYGTIPNGDNKFSRRIKETQFLIKKVETTGFEELMLNNELMDYLENAKIFK